jgi:hypothetical protein
MSFAPKDIACLGMGWWFDVLADAMQRSDKFVIRSYVFLDKPIANSLAEGRAITEACRKAGVVLALG